MTRHPGDEALRDQFLLDPSVSFFNHGCFGACPRPVMEAYQAWQLELERQPVEFLGRRMTERMRWARGVLAAELGANIDDIVYVSNATTGLNTVARALRLNPGDEVLATDHEYGALDRTWRFVCRKAGATYVRQPVRLPATSQREVAEQIWAGVSDRTRVLFLSHISSLTALRFPVDVLISRARDAGVGKANNPGLRSSSTITSGRELATSRRSLRFLQPSSSPKTTSGSPSVTSATRS